MKTQGLVFKYPDNVDTDVIIPARYLNTANAQELAKQNVDILDITQTVLQEYFTMVMLVDPSACTQSIGDMADILEKAGREQELSIRIQREDIFNAMHRI